MNGEITLAAHCQCVPPLRCWTSVSAGWPTLSSSHYSGTAVCSCPCGNGGGCQRGGGLFSSIRIAWCPHPWLCQLCLHSGLADMSLRHHFCRWLERRMQTIT